MVNIFIYLSLFVNIYPVSSAFTKNKGMDSQKSGSDSVGIYFSSRDVVKKYDVRRT